MQSGGSGTSGRDSGFYFTIKHQATHRLLCSKSLAEKNIPVNIQLPYSPDLALSEFRCSFSGNGPQGETFRNRGGPQIECDGRTLEDSKGSLLTSNNVKIDEASVYVCVCACVRARARVRAQGS
jgi:hypothetical protein